MASPTIVSANVAEAEAMAELLVRDPEAWSAVQGMRAMLALPALIGGRRRVVEVEVAGEWHMIDRVAVSAIAITLSVGTNGHRHEWVLDIAAGAPKWRCDHQAPRHELGPAGSGSPGSP